MKKNRGVALAICILMIGSVFSGFTAYAESDVTTPEQKSKVESTTKNTKGEEPPASKGEEPPALGENEPAENSSTLIKDYLEKAEIITSDGKPYNPEGGDKLNPYGSFDFSLYFSEIANGDNARQFPQDGIMTYQIPTEQITGFNAVTSSPIKDVNTQRQIGTYSIDAAGLITVDLDDEFVEQYANIEAFLAFSGSFSKEFISGGGSDPLEFSQGVAIDVTFTDKAKLVVTKDITTPYNYETQTIGYSVKVITDYTAKGVVITDTMDSEKPLDGRRVATVGDSIRVTNKAGEAVPFTKTFADGAWKIAITGDIPSGEVYMITYDGKVTDEALAQLFKTYSVEPSLTVNNKAQVTSENSETQEVNKSTKINFQRLAKVKEVSGNQIVWTVTVNKDKCFDYSKYKVTDTMEEGLVIDKKSPIIIQKNGVNIDSPEWADISSTDNSWSYTIPENSGKSAFTFKYKTNLPIAQIGDLKFNNHVELSNEESDIKYVVDEFYRASGQRALEKKNGGMVQDGEDWYIKWYSQIRVPKEGLDNVEFLDWIDTASKSNEFANPLKLVSGNDYSANKDEITIDGYDGPKTLVQKSNKEFSIYFGDTADREKSSIAGSKSLYTITIRYYTKLTGEDNGKRKNWAKLNYGTKSAEDWEEVLASPSMTGDKAGQYDATKGTILWKVKVNTNQADLNNQDIKMLDTFSENQSFDKSYRPTVEVNSKTTALEDSSVIEKSPTQYEFNLGKGLPNKTYTLTYQTKVKDGIFSEQENVVKFKNRAVVSTGDKDWFTANKEISVNNKFITKGIKNLPTLANRYKASFAISVNANKATISPGGAIADYVIEDKYSTNLDLDLNSIVITKNGKALNKNEYIVSHNVNVGEKENLLKITIPKADGNAYKITYDATVIGKVGETITYKNTAKLLVGTDISEDNVEKEVVIKKQSSSAGAGGEKAAISVSKHDQENIETLLPGAVFELYKDTVSEENLLGTQTTDANGKAAFGQGILGSNNLTFGGKAYYLESGEKYILVEKSAPEGYVKGNKSITFQLSGKKNPISNVDTYNMGKEFNVTNEKQNFHIQKIAADTQEILSGAEFTLYRDKDCKNQVKVGVAQGGIHTFNGLEAGTYYLKETKAPSGYYNEEKVRTVVLDSTGKVTIDGAILPTDTMTYTVKNTLAGSIKVTKEVTLDDELVTSDKTFYVSLFSDENCTNQIGETKALAMNGGKYATAIFEGLPINTYHIAETTKDGKVITDSVAQVGADEIAYNNKTITLTRGNLIGEGKIINKSYTVGRFDIKKVASNTGAMLEGAEFTLYRDKDCNSSSLEQVGTIDSQSPGIHKFENIKQGTYYLRETKVPTNYQNTTGTKVVVVGKGNSVTIDGTTLDKTAPTYTIANTLKGTISVTKEVTLDDVATGSDKTFYAALFKDAECKNMVGGTLVTLEMKGNQSTTANFGSLPLGTYYVAETTKDGEAITDPIRQVGAHDISYENKVVTINKDSLTGSSKITNVFYSEEYFLKGSIEVTKAVTLNGKLADTDLIFYTALFSDEKCTDRVSDVKALAMNGKGKATVDFTELDLKSYYIAETDAEGNPIKDSMAQLGCDMNIDNALVDITADSLDGKVTITNKFEDDEEFLYDGKVKVEKTTTFNGKAYKSDDIFYAALFTDAAHKNRLTDVKAIKMKGGSTASISFTGLAYGKYYLAETDKSGKALTDSDAQDRGFASVLINEAVTIADSNPVEFQLENQYTEEYMVEKGDKDQNNTKTDNTDGSVKTGDDNKTPLYAGIALLAAVLLMAGLWLRKRHRK